MKSTTARLRATRGAALGPCKVAGRTHRLHEISRFVREGGRWYYLDGELRAAQR
jgi:uncharacterized protein YchJ